MSIIKKKNPKDFGFWIIVAICTIVWCAGMILLITSLTKKAHAETATFYTGSSQPLADGTRYGANGWNFCAAGHHIPLGAKLRVTCLKSRRVRVLVVRDRGAFGERNLDLPSRGFSGLVGPGWREMGRVAVRYTIVAVPRSRHFKRHRKAQHHG